MPSRLAATTCAILLAAPHASIAQRMAPPAATAPGYLTVDAREYGIVSGNQHDSAPGLQAAVDALGAKVKAANVANPGANFTGILKIPAAPHPYFINQPIWVDHGSIAIEGEDMGTTISLTPNSGFPAFILCLPRAPVVKGKAIRADPSYRPDLFGKLDATAAPARGRRWGFRTKEDGFLLSQASSFTAGVPDPKLGGMDSWRTIRTLTVDFAVEVFAGPHAQLFGAGEGNSRQACPLIVYTMDRPNRYRVGFMTQDEPYGPPTPRQFDFTVPGAGLQRVAFQIDLDEGTVAAFGNGAQLPMNLQLGPGWRPGLRFRENDYYPFTVGDLNAPTPHFGATHPWDFALYGLAMSASLKYADRGPNTRQSRLDGKPATDRNRYFPYGEDPTIIGQLDFREDPATETRHLAIQGNPDRSSALLCQALQSVNGGIGGIRLRNLHILGARLGIPIAIAQALDLRISNVRVDGGFASVGNLYLGANYKIVVEDCSLSGTDSGIMMLMSQVLMRNVDFPNSGRVTMRFAGCNVDASHMDVAFWNPNNQATIALHSHGYGGIYTFRDLSVDYEGQSYGRCFCYAERHPYNGQTALKFEDINLGTIGKVPLFILKEATPANYSPGRLMVDNLQTFAPPGSVVALDGPRWYGQVTNSAFGDPPARVTHSGGPGARANVQVVEDHFDGPPTKGSWHAGAHVLKLRDPSAGHAELRCIRSGTYGTPTPPRWATVGPMAPLAPADEPEGR